jgi:regulator of nucleoside diphosphate kinase
MSRCIYITDEDLKKLKKLVSAEEDNEREAGYVHDLAQELARAQIVAASAMPEDVITMNSRALLRVDGEEEEVWLVYPHETDASRNRISVLSPIGTAILGDRAGDCFEWHVPDGTVRVEVIRVLYQPEADAKRQSDG